MKNQKCFPKTAAGGLLDGSVHASFKQCGKAGCKCSSGALHGPYYYRYRRVGARVKKEYVRLSEVEAVRAACARHRSVQDGLREGRKHFQALLSQLRTSLGELSDE
jgi:hypothetical protein